MKNQTHNSNWKPEFIYPTTPTGQTRIDELIGKTGIMIFDEMWSQLKELIEQSNPSTTYSAKELEDAINSHLRGKAISEYGVWVYYEWSNRLVHLLEEKEFITLRTDRNRNKITPEEQEVFLTKKIGLMGLSVGNSIAITLAMERCFGELRLADYDELELTNLNRIRTGVHNLGLSKAISTAREIMEIDPYLNITCFTEGVTANNTNKFMTGGGKLDLLIDECDSLNIKVTSRINARQLGIPVIMQTSDRGMTDVERFDLEPNRGLFHGLIEELSIEKLATLKTTEEKLPYVMAMVGFNTISNRLKSSLPEIGKTIKTWPQLASSVSLGAGIVSDIAKRIFLKTHNESGRYYVDLKNIFENK